MHRIDSIDDSVRYEWDPRTQDIHERFVRTTVDEFAARMPDVTYPGAGEAAHLLITPHDGDYDHSEAITYAYPFANGNALHLGIRAMYLADITDKQVLAFPNNTAGETYYTLTDLQRAQIAGGNFAPLADKFLATALGSLAQGSETQRLTIAGYSFGGVMAAAMFANPRAHEQTETDAVSVQEPANALRRSLRELRKAFMASGMDDVYDAARGSGIPALYEAMHPSGIASLMSLAKFALGTQLNPNRQLNAGMTDAQLFADLCDGLDQSPDTIVQIVGASGSEIFPYETQKDVIFELNALYPKSTIDAVHLKGTHAIGDEVVNTTLAIKRAINLARTS